MAQIPLNPDLPSSYQVPGVYVYSSKAGSAPSASNRRVLLLGYKTSAGTAQAGSIKRICPRMTLCAGLAKARRSIACIETSRRSQRAQRARSTRCCSMRRAAPRRLARSRC